VARWVARHTTRGALAGAALAAATSAALAVSAVVASQPAGAGAPLQAGPAGRPAQATEVVGAKRTAGVITIKVKTYGSVLADPAGDTLYLLSTERGGHLHCKGACLDYWPPLLVSKGTRVGVGTGVRGKVGTVSRSAALAQVTFNGYPVYGYVGDSGRAEAHGEKLKAFGGTWYMLRPSAKTPPETPVK